MCINTLSLVFQIGIPDWYSLSMSQLYVCLLHGIEDWPGESFGQDLPMGIQPEYAPNSVVKKCQ